MERVHLSKDDYEEPRCPFCKSDEVKSIPMGRVIEKLDEYLGRNDYASALKHLEYWLEEAQTNSDFYGKLGVLNELIGLYRKTGKSDEGLKCVSDALEISQALEIEDTVFFGTTLINAATAFKAFDKPQEALPLYLKAQKIYEEKLSATDDRLGGLYNNMALTVMALGEIEKARSLFEKAIEIMSKNPCGEAEMAVTYCNLADLAAQEYGLEQGEEEIRKCLDRAYELLLTPTLCRNGNYAFVCEKCAPTFGYYGYFAAQWELDKTAREIYERS